MTRHQGAPPGAQPAPQAQAWVEARQVEVTQWEAAHHTYRDLLATLSLTRHPIRISDSAPQPSAQVASQLPAMGEASAALVQRHQLPARPAAMTKVRQQVPALAALVDVWWQSVHQEVEPFVLSPRWRQWVDECRLPMVSWAHQVARMRCRRRQTQMQAAWDAVRTACDQHAITQRLAPAVLAAWQAGAWQRTKAFQRTSSAVEGRTGYLSILRTFF
jgi:hypothetical protein